MRAEAANKATSGPRPRRRVQAVAVAYNSLNASVSNGMGRGWSWNYGMHLRFDATRRTVVQENGSEVGFSPGPNGSWVAPARFDATLTKVADDWLFVRNTFEQFTFDATGRLTSIAGQNGYPTTVDYDDLTGRLATVKDHAERTLTFSWVDGRISQVTDSSNPPRSVELTYDQNTDELDSYEAVDEGRWEFDYDPAHQMTKMVDPVQSARSTPAAVVNAYDGQGRVVTQTDRAGGVWQFDYTSVSGATKVTSPGGVVTLDRYAGGVRTEHVVGYGTTNPSVWKLSYDPWTYQIARLEDPDGTVTTAEYDVFGNCTRS